MIRSRLVTMTLSWDLKTMLQIYFFLSRLVLVTKSDGIKSDLFILNIVLLMIKFLCVYFI